MSPIIPLRPRRRWAILLLGELPEFSKASALAVAAILALASCEAPSVEDPADASPSGNVPLHFQPTTKDVTRSAISGYFSRLNVQLF